MRYSEEMQLDSLCCVAWGPVVIPCTGGLGNHQLLKKWSCFSDSDLQVPVLVSSDDYWTVGTSGSLFWPFVGTTGLVGLPEGKPCSRTGGLGAVWSFSLYAESSVPLLKSKPLALILWLSAF